MADGIEAQGTKLEVSEDAGTTYTPVKGIRDISGFDGEASDIDASTLDSLAKEYLTGLADNGRISLSGNRLHDDPGQTIIQTSKDARTQLDYRITFSDGVTATFKGNAKSRTFSASVDALLAFDASIKISGAVTFANP